MVPSEMVLLVHTEKVTLVCLLEGLSRIQCKYIRGAWLRSVAFAPTVLLLRSMQALMFIHSCLLLGLRFHTCTALTVA